MLSIQPTQALSATGLTKLPVLRAAHAAMMCLLILAITSCSLRMASASSSATINFGSQIGVGSPGVFGFNDGNFSNQSSCVSQHKAVGFGLVRFGQNLSNLVPYTYNGVGVTVASYRASLANGSHDGGPADPSTWWWGPNDDHFNSYYNAGCTMMVTVGYTPDWLGYKNAAKPSGDNHTAATDWDVWQDIMTKYLAHYQGKISYLEVWNEPDGGFLTTDGTPYSSKLAEYMDIYVHTVNAVKASVSPNIPIGGFSSCEPYLHNISDWLPTMLANPTIAANFSFLTYHAYQDYPTGTTWNAAAWKTVLASNGKANLPIFITEWNYWLYGNADMTMFGASPNAVGFTGAAMVQAMKEGIQGLNLFGANDQAHDSTSFTMDSNDVFVPKISAWKLLAEDAGLGLGTFNIYQTSFTNLTNAVGAVNASGNSVAVLVNYDSPPAGGPTIGYSGGATGVGDIPNPPTSVNVTLNKLPYSGTVNASIFTACASGNSPNVSTPTVYKTTLHVINGTATTTVNMPVNSIVAIVVGGPMNSGFETGDLSGWATWNNGVGAPYIGAGHTGSHGLTFYNSAAYSCSAYQTITGLPNGTYTFSAWIQNWSSQKTLQLFAKNFGGSELDTAIPNTNGNWVLETIPNVPVTNGQCQIGIYTIANASDCCFVDDATFTLD